MALFNEGIKQGMLLDSSFRSPLNLLFVMGILILMIPVGIALAKYRDKDFWTIFINKLGVPSTSISVKS